MPLATQVSSGIATRFREVQELLSFIRQAEVPPPAPDSVEVRILRGLFYVHLYGAFEYSINNIVGGATRAINAAAIPHNKVTHPLGVLVLDGPFRSVAMAGTDSRWAKRLDLIRLRISSETAQISDGAIDLQNVWLNTLAELFEVFGIDKTPVYDLTKTGYIRELVDTRNKIAHGRESPVVTGSQKRSSDLQQVYDAIQKQTYYVLDCFNEYIKQTQFLIRGPA